LSKRRQRLIAGLTLILLGLALFALDRIEGLGQAAVFFLVGGAFLAAYLARREYGFLIPAGVLLGLGLGKIGRHGLLGFADNPLPFGLGCGFVSIWVIALLYQRRSPWWPLIPGAILILVGLPDTEVWLQAVRDNWPLLLVVAGVIVLLAGLLGPKHPREGGREG